MLETVTRLYFSMPASLNASSNEANLSLLIPTPLVRKILVGTNMILEDCLYLKKFAKTKVENKKVSINMRRPSTKK